MAYLNNDDIVSRIYSGFRGVDFRGDEVNLVRSPDSKNVWKDYKETESIRTRPGMKLVYQHDKKNPIYNVFFFKDEMLAAIKNEGTALPVITGTGVFKVENGSSTLLMQTLVPAKFTDTSFVYGDILYMIGGDKFVQYNGTTVKDVEPYIPTTSIARKPAGGGTIHEDVNLLSYDRKNTFLADGESTDFYLDSPNIDKTGDYVKVKVNGVVTKDYTVDYEKGCIKFNEAPPAPNTDGQDNVEIQFRKMAGVKGTRNQILGCRLLAVFDNRVFVGGNPAYPNTIWHCSLNDPSYFSDLDYYKEGLDEAMVTGMVPGNNALWVFREPSDGNTTVFYHTPTIDSDYGKIYPSQHSSVSTGCVGRAINFNDDIVFFSERGMEGISGDVTTEQVIAHRSTLVDRKLTTEKNYKDMVLAEWEGYLIVFIGNKAYLADSRAMFTNNKHVEYDWFYWELEKNVTCAAVHNGILYVGTDDGGIYSFTDKEADIESYWTTPKDKFKYPQRLKTTNKRGCVVEATGDVSVYAKLEDTDFELIGKYENITDYFVCRIKRKKFKDLQLRFYSDKRFSLETATIECFVGGYIKR